VRVGLYVHIPFCRTRCHFCAFALQIHRPDRVQRYLAALAQEIELHAQRGSLAGRQLDTVYFGGGTPTVLPVEQLIAILDHVRAAFSLTPAPEVTVEAHPDTVTGESLHELVRAGFTRISFGAQSMNDVELLSLGRRTSSNRLRAAVSLARAAGFTNINLDLIYGVPAQTLTSWVATLDTALSLEPTHISCYALTIEEHTRLYVDMRRGDYAEPDAVLQNEMEDAAAAQLAAAGFLRYELSNYARPGYACRHNLLYWQGEDYLGLGPDAQSYLDGRRFGNCADVDRYCHALATGQLPLASWEVLSPEQRWRERIVFGLRLLEGVDITLVDQVPADRTWRKTLADLVQRGLLENQTGKLRLTKLGRRFADSVAVALI
jgi:oxygen-independent coproporphyrinogen-3 oxidase